MTQQAPVAFLLQPHEMYPMTRADFDYWVAILRSNFPDHPRLAGLGTEFVPFTPEQASADEEAKERNRFVDEMRLAGGGCKRFPGIHDAIDWLEAMKVEESLLFLRGDRGMLMISKSATGTYAAHCSDARGRVLAEAAGIDGESMRQAVRRYLVGDVKRCLNKVRAHGYAEVSAVDERQVGDVVVLDLRPAPARWGDEANRLMQRIDELLAQGRSRMVVNLSQVVLPSDLLLGVLVQGSAQCRRRGGHLIMCCLQERLVELIRIVKLESVLTIRGSEPEAVAYLRELEHG